MGYKRELEHEMLPEVSSKEPRLLTDPDGILEFDISYPENSISSFLDVLGVDGCDLDLEDELDEADSFITVDPGATPSSEFYMSSECSRKVVISRIVANHAFPRKPVPIGPGHQADLPDVISRSDYLTYTSGGTAQGWVIWTVADQDPFPRAEPVTCGCFEVGSIPCVRLHIAESRREMEEELTYPVFRSLGLVGMGETVAEEWSTEEEAEFYNIVCSNPRSSGRRFWRLLREVFLLNRTWGDLVSYYFNVFMLRRRAVQNRLGPSNVDSDDDEPPRGPSGLFYEEEEEDGGDGVGEGLVFDKGGCRVDLNREYWGEECLDYGRKEQSRGQKKGVVDLPAWSVIEGLLE